MILNTAIQITDLKKTFKSKGKTIEAVRGVNLSVFQGEIFAFLGPNGAGKTTCQRMLTTLLPIDDGSADVAGYDVAGQPEQVRRHIGYVSQLGGGDANATGRENLMLSGQLYGMKKTDVKEKITELSCLLEFDELLDRQVKTYSGGQKRRLEIALGILHEPQILFLDEPSAGLDPQNRANLWARIRKLRDGGMTVFLTTHYLDEADELCDRLAIIDHGKIVAEGTPFALKQQVSDEEVQARIKRETQSLATLDDVFLKMTGRSLRDTGKEEAQ